MVSALLGVLVATNQPSALSNLVHEKTGAKLEVVDPNDPVQREYLQLLALDQSAQDDAERWVAENEKFSAAGVGDEATLRLRIRQRFDLVEKAYKDFLARNPKHVDAHIAFGSFLGDIGREDEASKEYLKARDIDPKNPAPWNNLANYYGHNGPATNAFVCYEKAIELNPREPVYYQNFATSVYLFRRDATNHFNISEQQVFDKALGLYRQALALRPDDFRMAADLAQTYYGIQPPRIKDALQAWNGAFKLARDDAERQGVRLHMARWHRTAGDTASAQRELDQVQGPEFATTKARILKSLGTSTNRPANPAK
jgi:tetratricopeptide (TPR) repeat protein